MARFSKFKILVEAGELFERGKLKWGTWDVRGSLQRVLNLAGRGSAPPDNSPDQLCPKMGAEPLEISPKFQNECEAETLLVDLRYGWALWLEG